LTIVGIYRTFWVHWFVRYLLSLLVISRNRHQWQSGGEQDRNRSSILEYIFSHVIIVIMAVLNIYATVIFLHHLVVMLQLQHDTYYI
jgi:heme/copper-type cytochrome/quinol oxidase subunit 2